jgi:putative NIF3 family GTP cyclohydrolase 1 type 2
VRNVLWVLRRLIQHDIAVYAAHLPLDAHAELGNAALLARTLGLTPLGGFAEYAGVHVGVQGDARMPTLRLLDKVREFAATHGTVVRSTAIDDGQHTQRWGICTGAGANSDTLREAAEQRIDTLIVGEGPHHTAIEARELGITVIYAGHYATETLGVQAAAARVSAAFGIPWHFIAAPTGL